MRKGDVIRVKIPGSDARPLAHIVRQSRRTGTLTVELVEACGAYTRGAMLHVSPHECESAVETRQ